METLRDNIDQFTSFFHEQLGSIHSAQFPKNGNIFKKILYVAIIDALSKTVYPKKGNRNRFVYFVRSFSGWDYCKRISLPHLVRLLQRDPDPEFSNLREFAFPLFDKWDTDDEQKLDEDPDCEEVQKRWSKNKAHARRIEKVPLDFIRHDHLLYTYRNSLVHELRYPGYGMESGNEPFYHYRPHLDVPEKSSWQLAYPVGFFEAICKTALENLKKYYTINRIDPCSFFSFGPYWIEELNR